jgi:hypothetical protein
MRGKANFRQSDLTKAIKAIEAAGQKVRRVEISAGGKIVVVIVNDGDETEKIENSWDEVYDRK